MDWRQWEYCLAETKEWEAPKTMRSGKATHWGIEVRFPDGTRSEYPLQHAEDQVVQHLEFLRSMGTQGWELVQHTAQPDSNQCDWIFKRPAEGPSS